MVAVTRRVEQLTDEQLVRVLHKTEQRHAQAAGVFGRTARDLEVLRAEKQRRDETNHAGLSRVDRLYSIAPIEVGHHGS